MKNTKDGIISQDGFYDSWDYGEFSRVKADRILKYMPKKDNIKFLDVACGNGQFYGFLKDTNCEYTGLEFSKKQVEKGKKKGLDIRYHDLTKKWPFKEGTFDVVLASEILEHIYDTDYFLEECRRVLKKNGVLILTTPNIVYLGARIRCLFGRRPPSIEYNARGIVAGHIRAFSYYDLRELFKNNKLEIEAYTGFDFYLPFISSRTKYFGKISDILSTIFPKLSPDFIIKAVKK